MTEEPGNAERPTDPLEASGASGGRRSVLDVISSIVGKAPKVFLRSDSGPEGASPVIDPKTKEAHVPLLGRGTYQVLGEIARGGMGVVLKGHDTDLGRDVALKVLHEHLAQDPTIVQRFVEEAQIGGQLQHPGIVPVYELGLMADERPYFTMKLVKGRTLSALLSARTELGQDHRRFLSIFESVCQTMAYAHSRGVIHRDLKPSNIMVGAFGEVQVVDWGLAKVLRSGGTADEERAQTVSQVSVIETVRSGSSSTGSDSVVGSVLGTPAFMPPEQARGEVEQLDERSDVFGLGGILAVVLTGEPPYSGPREEALRAAARAELGGLRTRLADCGAEAELVELCLECLTPAPSGRPAHAGALAARLHAHLASVEERARTAQLAAAEARVRAEEERARAAQERRARKLTVALSGSLLLAVTLGVGGWLWVDAKRSLQERRIADRVQDSLDEAFTARGAQRWEDAIAAARHARDLAETGESGFGLLGEVDRLLADLEAKRLEAERQAQLDRDNAALLAELQETLRPESGIVPSAWVDTDRAIHEIFRRHGLTPDQGSEEQAAQQLIQRGIPAQLAAELDVWAGLRWQSKRAAAASRLTHIAQRIDPDETRTRLRQAFAARDLETLLAAAEGPEADSLPAVTLCVLGRALATIQQLDAVVSLFRRVLDRHPQDFSMHMIMAQTLVRLGRGYSEEAVRHLYAARVLRPGSPGVSYWLGEALAAVGDTRAAMASYRQALELDPDYAAALNDLSWFLATAADPSLRDPEQAVRHARRLIQLTSDVGTGWNTLGVALYRAGRLDECLEALDRSMAAFSGGEPHDWLFYAMAYQRLGDEQEARVWYDRALDWMRTHPAPDGSEEELARFHAEAAELLGVTEEEDDR